MGVNQVQSELDFSIINTKMAVESMRSSGYKSTSHALAELIDNSIESEATSIEVFGISEINIGQRQRFRVSEIAVLDNGSGMDKQTLRRSLRYGDGTRFERGGIGRFGLGLPNSSMSQAKRVDVWSWQSGVTNAHHTWLSIKDVMQGSSEIPEPQLDPIPSIYRECSLKDFKDSGTLVVWTELDRVEWKLSATIFQHIQSLLGRIYRRYLADPQDRLHQNDDRTTQIGQSREIVCIPVRKDDHNRFEIERKNIVNIKPNDPLYLMQNSQCPEKFGTGPMFQEMPGSPFKVPIVHNENKYDVLVRASYARAHVRDYTHDNANWPSEYKGKDAGHTPWGKDANRNLGVSIVRAHREIQLDDSWVNGNDPTERWWKVEVDFPTYLDEIFGVSNNKQSATTFQLLANFDWTQEAFDGEDSEKVVIDRMRQDGDNRANLLQLRSLISQSISIMRTKVKQSSIKRKVRHEVDEEEKADQKATETIVERSDSGNKGESDKLGEEGTQEEQKEQHHDSLVHVHNYDEDKATQLIDEALRSGHKVRWITSSQSSPAFFDVNSLPKLIQVALNINHPVYKNLYEVMHPDIEDLDEDNLRDRLQKTSAAFRLLIYSWARYEDEQSDKARRIVRDARLEWGKYAEEFLDDSDTDLDESI